MVTALSLRMPPLSMTTTTNVSPLVHPIVAPAVFMLLLMLMRLTTALLTRVPQTISSSNRMILEIRALMWMSHFPRSLLLPLRLDAQALTVIPPGILLHAYLIPSSPVSVWRINGHGRALELSSTLAIHMERIRTMGRSLSTPIWAVVERYHGVSSVLSDT
jgi:hypothetical protein